MRVVLGINYYLDGEYQGLYILYDKIETRKRFFNIRERVDKYSLASKDNEAKLGEERIIDSI